MKHLSKLPYVEAVVREVLRLRPTAIGFTRRLRTENTEKNPTIGGGKYAITKNTSVVCLLTKIQRDPAVWGPNADEFEPERMLDDKFNKLPKNAWKVGSRCGLLSHLAPSG